MKIALGTLKTPKIEGVQSAVAACPYFASAQIEYILESVPSDISDMPLSIEETMQGAKNRAQNLIKKGIQADYYVGIEGGTTDISGKKYILGSIYVENTSGEGHYGFSPFLEVPQKITEMLYKDGLELGPIMSELSGITNIQSQHGSMGAWTNDMFTRKEEFNLAFKAAIAPFYNSYYTL